jgi:hypothetical protein
MDNYSDPDESTSQLPNLLVEIQEFFCRAQILKVEATSLVETSLFTSYYLILSRKIWIILKLLFEPQILQDSF